jgi:hypothetical protein
VGSADATASKRERTIVEAVRRAFTRAYRREPAFAAVRPGDGARRERVQ